MFHSYFAEVEGEDTLFERAIRIIEERTKNNDGKYYGYIGGEFDSNQTRYENLSNNGVIGVVAKDEVCAKVLLRLLRCVVDVRDDPVKFFDSLVYPGGDLSNDDVFMKYAGEETIDRHDIDSYDSPIEYTLLTRDGEVKHTKRANEVMWVTIADFNESIPKDENLPKFLTSLL